MKIDLRFVFLAIPTGYADGKVVSYRQKSIRAILVDNFDYEVAFLLDWLKQQIINFFGCYMEHSSLPTEQLILICFDFFEKMNIKPKDCTYLEEIADATDEQI
jgi:hypothetical protein